MGLSTEMALYTFRCPEHGDFDVEQPMAETTRTAHCTTCGGGECPKVLGGHLHFTYGRDQFHDGPMGDGQTLRETQRDWLTSARAAGLEPEGVGYRHI